MFQDIATCLKTFDVAVFDISGHINLAFRMTRSAFLEVCAIIKVVCMCTHTPNQFYPSSLSLYLYLMYNYSNIQPCGIIRQSLVDI
jgi:hypothetical protein